MKTSFKRLVAAWLCLLFLLSGCASDEIPPKNNPSILTPDVLNQRITFSQASTWKDDPIPTDSSSATAPSFTAPDNLTFISGQDVELLLTFQNAPTQDFDLLLRFGANEDGYRHFGEIHSDLNGNQLSLLMSLPEDVCKALIPAVHEVSLNLSVAQGSDYSDVETVTTYLDCSVWEEQES